MSNKVVHFIINPTSGIGQKNKLPALIEKHLSKEFQYELHFTRHAGHGNLIAKYLVTEEAFMIVAVGGDGSVNEVASGLINSNTLLGIIPTGSGNGFAHHFNIPENIKKAIDVINSSHYEKCDAGKFGKHYFFSNCGVGIDASIARDFEMYHSRGFWSYVKLSIKNYFNYQKPDTELVVDGKKIDLNNSLIVSIANTAEFGNRFQIAPNNDHADGQFEVVIFKKPPLLVLPFTMVRFFNKSIRKSKYTSYFTSNHIEISSFNHIQKDGDWIDEQLESIEIIMIPFALKVVCEKDKKIRA